MHLNVPPDLEKLINKRLSSSAFADAEDVVRHALQAQDAEEGLTGEERDAIAAHIDEGYQQAERSELIDGSQAQRDIQALKDRRRSSRR